MKHTILPFSLMPILAVLLASCSHEIQESVYVAAPEISASLEQYGATKTQLVVDGEGKGTIYWKPADQINVFYGTEGTLYTSKNTENVTVATFKTTDIIGESEEASTNIWGLYPYNEAATCDGSMVTTSIVSSQYGVPETFDTDLFTTLAHSESHVLRFFNVCGGIKFSLSRADITKITFKGNNNEALAGKVNLTFSDDFPVATVVEPVTTVTLTPKTGKTFEKDVNYYIITLPVSMSNGFTMTFETMSQIGTFNHSGNEVVISRSKFGRKAEIDKYATFVDKSEIDLSLAGTSNCYIVSSAGAYKFKAVQGNSSSSVGDVKGVKVLWETFGTDVEPAAGDLIDGNVSYYDGYIKFGTNSTFREGNAVIAAYSDADCSEGNVLWSWHIWLTDQPAEQVYNNGAGTLMDRNLGATSVEPGDVQALGLLYQWGRKDPFLGSSNILEANVAKSTLIWPSVVTSDENYGTIAYAVSHPTTFISGSYDWYYSSSPENTRWQTSDYEKGLYDPCPAGWRVPDGGENGVWAQALGSPSTISDGPFDKTNRGMDFGSDNGKASSMQMGTSSSIWYPAAGSIFFGGIFRDVGYYASYLSATPVGVYAFSLVFYGGGSVYPIYNNTSRDDGHSVRCCKDIPYFSVSPAEISVTAADTSASFNIKTREAWTCSSQTEGFSVNKTSGTGNATVTVSFSANEDSLKVRTATILVSSSLGEKTVTITQDKKGGSSGTKFVKVTSNPSDWSGCYLIVWGKEAHATVSGKDLAKTLDIVEKDGIIDFSEELLDATVEIEKTSGGYSILLPSGKYLSCSKAENRCSEADAPFTFNSITVANGISGVDSKSVSRYLYDNSSFDGHFYRFYPKQTSSSYSVPTLYKLTK